MQYETVTESAARIRKTLKARFGYTSKQVSVRAESYSMGSSVHVVVRDPAISLAKVKPIAESAERISYDHASGEILSGGNRFIHLSHSNEAREAIVARYRPAVDAAVAKIEPGSPVLVPVEGVPFLVGGDAQRDWAVKLWSAREDCAGMLCESAAENIAYRIGCEILDNPPAPQKPTGLRHSEHAREANVATPCTAAHVTFGGRCLNCGWEPPVPYLVREEPAEYEPEDSVAVWTAYTAQAGPDSDGCTCFGFLLHDGTCPAYADDELAEIA